MLYFRWSNGIRAAKRRRHRHPNGLVMGPKVLTRGRNMSDFAKVYVLREKSQLLGGYWREIVYGPKYRDLKTQTLPEDFMWHMQKNLGIGPRVLSQRSKISSWSVPNVSSAQNVFENSCNRSGKSTKMIQQNPYYYYTSYGEFLIWNIELSEWKDTQKIRVDRKKYINCFCLVLISLSETFNR